MKAYIPFIAAVGDINRYRIFTNGLIENTIFDLASLTKPLVTLKYTLKYYEQGDSIFGIDIIKLITHSAGIPQKLPWMNWKTEEYFENVASYKGTISGFDYSCHNYNLLAHYVYIKSGKYPLEHLQWKDEGYLGMGIKHSNTLPIVDGKTYIGIPHDGKARLLKEKAGNAGLFGNIRALIRVAQRILNGRWYSIPVEEFSKPHIRGIQRYSLGWFLYSTRCKTCGSNFSFRSFGHSGFPGSFIWFHPDNKTFQIFLSHSINHIRRRIERFRFLGQMSNWLYKETLKD